MPDLHTVWRHGGAQTHRWREVYTGPPEEAAARYKHEGAGLRQGRVLVLPEGRHPLDEDAGGEIVRADGQPLFAYAPCLRTKW